MEKFPIYTVGYGNRSIDTFVKILQKYEIRYLADIRSQPYSRFNQQFSKASLENYLYAHRIRYMFLGDTLGGRPKDEDCYDEKGRVEYAKLSSKSFYQEGIDRLRTAWEKNLQVAIMCTEVKPSECHRGKLIGNTLVEQGITVAHIDESGNIKQQKEVNQLILGVQPSLLDETLSEQNEKIGFSRKTYLTWNKQEDVHAT